MNRHLRSILAVFILAVFYAAQAQGDSLFKSDLLSQDDLKGFPPILRFPYKKTAFAEISKNAFRMRRLISSWSLKNSPDV